MTPDPDRNLPDSDPGLHNFQGKSGSGSDLIAAITFFSIYFLIYDIFLLFYNSIDSSMAKILNGFWTGIEPSKKNPDPDPSFFKQSRHGTSPKLACTIFRHN